MRCGQTDDRGQTDDFKRFPELSDRPMFFRGIGAEILKI